MVNLALSWLRYKNSKRCQICRWKISWHSIFFLPNLYKIIKLFKYFPYHIGGFFCVLQRTVWTQRCTRIGTFVSWSLKRIACPRTNWFSKSTARQHVTVVSINNIHLGEHFISLLHTRIIHTNLISR